MEKKTVKPAKAEAKETKKAVEKKPAPKAVEKKPAPKAAEKKPAPKAEVKETKNVVEPAVGEKKVPADVHEVLHTADGRWAVKRKNSEKVIKYFTTKKEAMEYVVVVSANQDTKLVVQKKNGAFQKLSNAIRGVKKN